MNAPGSFSLERALVCGAGCCASEWQGLAAVAVQTPAYYFVSDITLSE